MASQVGAWQGSHSVAALLCIFQMPGRTEAVRDAGGCPVRSICPVCSLAADVELHRWRRSAVADWVKTARTCLPRRPSSGQPAGGEPNNRHPDHWCRLMRTIRCEREPWPARIPATGSSSQVGSGVRAYRKDGPLLWIDFPVAVQIIAQNRLQPILSDRIKNLVPSRHSADNIKVSFLSLKSFLMHAADIFHKAPVRFAAGRSNGRQQAHLIRSEVDMKG